VNIVTIESLLGLFGLWIGICYLWRDFRNDSYREDIFSVRDEMFLYAAEGKISFDHPAYALLRLRMNRLLRHGLELTMTRLLILSLICDDVRSDSFNTWERAVEQLPDVTREQFKDFNLRINIFVFQHVLYLSFFRYLLLRPLMNGIRVRDVMEKPHVVTTVEKLESATLEEEEVCELVPA
jgi:hypothetical protein